MWRLALALTSILLGQIAHADCVVQIDPNDSQKAIQDKVDCLSRENARLRDQVTKAPNHPHVKSGLFTVASPQDLATLRANVINWIRQHQGTITNDTSVSPASAFTGVAGFVGDYSIGVTCFVPAGVCSLVAAGSNEQEISDAVLAIHATN
jgi:hypothetical protein